jgi:hypothetical protein
MKIAAIGPAHLKAFQLSLSNKLQFQQAIVPSLDTA